MNSRGALATTSRVWLKVSNLRWVAGIVESVTDVEVVIATDDGQKVKVPRGSDKVSQRTPKELEAVDNLTALPDLDEPNMLHSLNVRYMQNKIYTRTGPILVAMNPWSDLKLYGQDVLHSYRRVKIENVPPHVYAIGEAAFANLQSQRKDQTILVSGDSGSGKTESTKFMMQYLAAVAHHTHTARTEQKVLQCNPVLEAFGNAKTLRNDNSSRFGKYIDIHFDAEFALIGAKIDTYLLERSRVVSQQKGERNFHIFYQLASQYKLDKNLTDEVGLLSAEQFRYIQQGVEVSVGYRPATSFQNTVAALDSIGISHEEQRDIFRVLALVLHMGNLDFQSDADDNAILPVTDKKAIMCSRLMGVECNRFIESLLSRQIQAGPQGLGDSYTVSQTLQQAIDSRDALARALYGNMFDALVKRINQALLEQRISKIRTISILDIFGFEHFKSNHFEQFCINYANEKLQGHFNEFNFTLEIQEYEREKIQWSYEDFRFQTNTKCIELIEGRRTGMLALLDEQCIMPNGNDETYCTKLKNELGEHPYLSANKMKGTQFTVRHYAAEVVYDAVGFCFKNKDPVQPAIVDLMSNGVSDYLRSLFADYKLKMESKGNGSRRPASELAKSSIIFESVTAQFKRQLTDLMTRISAAQPHFVRCINPNSQKAPGKLEPEMILDQLRCSGLMEAVRVSRAGFPVRILHSDFLSRFSLLTPCPQGDPRTATQRMCVDLYISAEHYRIGVTKVFMRREIHERLEEDRSRLLVRQAASIQKVVRGHKARVYVKILRIMRGRAAVVIQKIVRRALVRNWFFSLLEKRKKLLAHQKQSSQATITSMPASPAPRVTISTTRERERSAPPPPPPPDYASPIASSPVVISPSPAINKGEYEELEVQLGSVRELYYNERESQLALTELVKEVCTMQDETQLINRIMSIDAKMESHRKESITPVKNVNFNNDTALSRRLDSLGTCKLLLEDKWNLIRQVKQAQVQVAMAQAQVHAACIEAQTQSQAAQSAAAQAQAAQAQAAQALAQTRAAQAQAAQSAAQAQAAQQLLQSQQSEYAKIVSDVRFQMTNEIGEKERAGAGLLSELKLMQERLEGARQELNMKDEAIIALHHDLAEAKSLLASRASEADDIAKRVEQLLQENELLKVKARTTPGPGEDEHRLKQSQQHENRIAELERTLSNERKERDSEFEAMDANIRARDAQIGSHAARCGDLEAALARHKAQARAALATEAERVELVARHLDGLVESLDAAALPPGVAKMLQIKLGELAEEQRRLEGGGGDPAAEGPPLEGRLQMVSAVRRLVATYSAVLARLVPDGSGFAQP